MRISIKGATTSQKPDIIHQRLSSDTINLLHIEIK